MQDDEYFAAYQALAELRGNQRSYLAPVGTPEAEKLDRLKRALSDAEQNIVDLPAPVIDMGFLDRLNEQDPGMAADPVAIP